MNNDDRPFERQRFHRVALPAPFGKTRDDGRSPLGGLKGVENANGDLLTHRGEYGFRMKHLRAEVRELSRFLEREFGHDFCVSHETRIGGIDAGYAGPYFPDLRL